ncbi:hypothetical protein ABFT23_21460 [Nocardioides sp. C4-1]|uniref:hypothetical protein n=1 Tax=Nocardioides sp. C4-1 TaxID=3151851 RepID=UPI003266B7C8
MSPTISQTQAAQIAQRLHYRGRPQFRFRADGTVVGNDINLVEWDALGIEIWECTSVQGELSVSRLTQLEVEPA